MKRKSILSISFVSLLVLCSIVITSCEKKDSEKNDKATIYGIITDYETLEPLQNVEVVLYYGSFEVARSQVTGMDGRYEMIFDQSVSVDYTSFYIEAPGYDAISTIGHTDRINIDKGDKRQIDFQMYSYGTFPLNGYFGFCPDYACLPYFEIYNRSSDYLSSVELSIGMVLGDDIFGSSYTFAFNPHESYRYSGYLWFRGDRAVLKTMNMSKTFIATTQW